MSTLPKQAARQTAVKVVGRGYEFLAEMLVEVSTLLESDADACESHVGTSCLAASAEDARRTARSVMIAQREVVRRATRIPKRKVEEHVDDGSGGTGNEGPEPSVGGGGACAGASQPRVRKPRARGAGSKGKRGKR